MNAISCENPTAIKIHVCDDHELITESISYLLKSIDFVEKVTYSNSKSQLFSFIKNNTVDVLILDINVSGDNMLINLPFIRKTRPETRVVILTTYDSSEFVKESIKKGAQGFVSKNTSKDELIFCFKQVLEGKRYVSRENRKEFVFKDNFELLNQLTDREIEVLKCLTKGYTNKRIADELNISVLTVQTHRKNMYSKLNLRGVNELVSFAYENNLYG